MNKQEIEFTKNLVKRFGQYLLFFLVGCFGASIKSQPTTFTFHKLGLNEGLSDLNGIYFEKDSRGFTWISTYDGLNRFDGYDVKTYYPKIDSLTVAHNITSKVFEDQDGNLWFSSQLGIHCLYIETDSIANFPCLDETDCPTARYYYLFHLDTEEHLWFTADSLLYTFNISTQTIDKKHVLPSYSCYPLLDSNESVTGIIAPLVERPGIDVYRYADNGAYEKFSFFTGESLSEFPEAKVLFSYVENENSVWLPADIGLIHFNPNEPKTFQLYVPQNPDFNGFWDLYPWKEDQFWLTSPQNGHYLFDREKEAFFEKGKQIWVGNQNVDLGNGSVLWVDDASNMWVSPWGKGLVYTNIENNKFTHLLRPEESNSARDRTVVSIAEDKQGHLWSSVQNEGIYRFEHTELNTWKKELVFSSQGSFRLLSTRSGDLWMQSKNQFIRVDDPLKKNVLLTDKPISGLIKVLEWAKDSFLLVGFKDLYIYTKGKFPERIYSSDSLGIYGRFHQCFSDQEGKVIISDGISDLYIFPDLPSDRPDTIIKKFDIVNDMWEDTLNHIWWFACDGGLIRMNPSDYSYERVVSALTFDKQMIVSILGDDEKIWLASLSHLFRYDPLSRNCQKFTSFDGIQTGGFSFASKYKTQDGLLAFGGGLGMNVFDPKTIQLNSNHAIPHIRNVIINGDDTLKNINTSQPRSFHHTKNTLAFDLIALEYSDPENNQLKIVLHGLGEDTFVVSPPYRALYPKLLPGKYELEILAANSDGLWNSDPQGFSFEIRSPWWKTWPAIISALTAFIIGIYTMYQYRVNLIKKKEQAKLEKAEQKQLLAETETAVLRLQMNPHFIFNSMTSISSYILQKDIDTANAYLVRFASLMRMILDYSEEQLISVEMENELLEKYLETEAMRFEKKFDHKITLADELDPTDWLIPTMILQPFVENAIWHGLSGKKAKGWIKISYWTEGQALYCSIEDNGIGREAAKVSKRHELQEHTSKALEITQRRLNLIEETNGVSASFKILDLYHSNQKPKGTKVIFCFPIFH